MKNICVMMCAALSLHTTLASSVLDAAIAEAVRLDGEAESAWSVVSSEQEAFAHGESLKAKMRESIGAFPERCDLEVRNLGTIQMDGYRVEKLVFASRPGHHVTAHLFLPDGKAPYPAIIMPCGHDDEGKLSRNHQRAAVIAAKKGFAALLCDPIDQGERIQLSSIPAGNVDGHVNAGLRAHLLGWGMAQFRVWDCIRGVDLLVSRKDIDGSRIGVAGMSGGGTLSTYLFFLDSRVKAACPMGFITDMRSLAVGPGPQDCEQVIFGQLAFGLNHLSFMLGAYPRPICPGFTYEDFFPYAGSAATFDKAKSFYSKYGQTLRIDKLECPGRHGWYESEKSGQVQWMRRWLCEDASALPFDRESLNALNSMQGDDSLDYALADRTEGKCLENGVMSLPGERSVYDIIADEAERLERVRGPITREAVRAILGDAFAARKDGVVDKSLRKGYWFGRGGESEQTAAVLAWLGRNFVAVRVEEMVSVAKKYIVAHDGKKMVLSVKGEDAIAAAHAWYLERELFAGIEIEDPPPSWQELIRNPNLRIDFRSVVYGALQQYDWTDLLDDSCWIRPSGKPTADHDTAVFRGTFVTPSRIERARWKLSSLGVMKAYVNGVEVGSDSLLKPGLTDVGKRRAEYSYDVTELLDCRAGATNRLEAVVAASWWRDQVVNAAIRLQRRTGSGFKAQLEYKGADHVMRYFSTSDRWLADYTGPVVSANIFDGETYDARIEPVVTNRAVVSDEFSGVVSPVMAEVVRRDDLRLRPVAAWAWKGIEGATSNCHGRVVKVREYAGDVPMTVRPGETLVVDFGQNTAGLPEFEFSAERGTIVTAASAEMLNDAHGESSRGNDGPAGSVYRASYRASKSQATYVFAGKGNERHVPGFTFFGGRFWSVTATGTVTIKSFSYVPIMSITKEDETLQFETGSADLNRLIENCKWGMRSNYISVPTDCPQRDERQGWTGDAQVYSSAAVWNADVRRFLSKWMTDMRDGVMTKDERYPGSFREVAPPGPAGCGGHRIGWSDAGVIVPYNVWKQYGDTSIIRDNWQAMDGYMALLSRTKYHTASNDYQYADWLSMEKYEQRKWFERAQPKDESEIEKRRYWDFLGAVYRIRNLRMMTEMAEAVGRLGSAARYRREEAEAVAEFRKTFLTEDGLLTEEFRDMLTPALFALSTRLLEGDAFRQTAKNLIEKIQSQGLCVRTGFLGTPILMDTLSETLGEIDLAYSLLLSHNFPSWLYSVDQGATTIWERWNGYTKEHGFGPVGMNSFNHYAYGAVEGWMVRTIAGIRPSDRGGFRRFVLAPSPDRRIGWAKAAYRCDQGEIRSEWRYGEDGKCKWSFTVPENSVAEVRVKGKDLGDYAAGTYVLDITD